MAKRGTGAAGRARTGSRLAHYWSKRDFTRTAEPRGEQRSSGKALSFVVQKHAASRLHYDFRLELDGVLVSWAVPKGPSYDPADKRLAVHVEDHPLSYGSFEGTIPAKQYGAGTVIVWDKGTWEPVGNPQQGIASGKLAFTLHGEKLNGQWELVKIAKAAEKQEPWLLFKKRDEFARPRADYDVVRALPDSVMSELKSTARKSSVRDQATDKAPARVSPKRGNGTPSGAIKAALPKKLSPQLATLVSAPPTEGKWIYEIKFDGYRIMARVDKGKVQLFTRSGHDWSSKMPDLVEEIKQLGVDSAWFDGEIVVAGENGLPDFNALQRAFDGRSASNAIQYFLFDVPFFEGHDLRQVELAARRQLLKSLLDEKATEHVLFSADFEADPATVLQSACSMHLEGVIAKRADAPYVSRRTDTWVKLKCKLRQEFVVCGYVERSDAPTQIGSLLLGVYDEAGDLVPVGRVGTGWDAAEARLLKEKLQKLATDTAPYKKSASASGTGSTHWVKPRFVAEVAFAQWTPDKQIRHASYIALRKDKPASNVIRETARTVKRPTKAVTSKVKVTHPDRVIDTSGLTKLDLVRYYESISKWMLPHLEGRPCSLVRAPSGVSGQQFFQKHGGIGITGVRKLDPSLWPGHEPLIEIDTLTALASAAQMNVIEFHTWNSRSKRIDKPDRMIFDLDPGAGTTWTHVQEAATLLRSLLLELKLQSWLKTSGGKGLHVVVPLVPRWNYDTVKGLSKVLVQHMARTIPSRFVAMSGPSNRVNKLFVDYLRNGHGATTVAAFSARARPGLGVSMPVAWEYLSNVNSGAHWTIRNAREHLSFQKRDPWADYWNQPQSLTEAMSMLSFVPKRGKPL